jgi:NSS family neurotransmitter:Na+ symporter
MTAVHENWSGRLGFLLATIGSAVGIGSIWKFPYEAGANGGGMFVAFYIVGLALIVVPLMFAEFATGRRGGGDPGHSLTKLARTHGATDGTATRWGLVGVLGVVTGFLILSFYAVIGGWTLGYAVDTALHGLPGTTAQAVTARYREFLASPWQMLGYHAVFMFVCAVIVARGISGGIETACMVLMPVLGVLMVALAGYSLIEGDFIAALRFLFVPDFSHFNARTALDALGLGFFSIGVGLGLMITYAAFAGADVNLRQIAIWSVLADTAISLLAGLAVFPVVFAHGLDPASGPGLVFVTLPLAFAQMPFGVVAAGAFFLLLFVAALASAISLLELAVAMLVRRYGWSQLQATALAATLCFVAGIATVLSFNHWAAWQPLAGMTWAKGLSSATVFDLLDYLTSNVLLPATGFGIAVFAGWVLPQRVLTEELGLTPRGAMLLGLLLRYVAPVSIAAIALASLVF